MLELLDVSTLRVVDEAHGTDYASRAGALVIAQTDGPAAEVEIAAIADVLGKEATWVERRRRRLPPRSAWWPPGGSHCRRSSASAPC